MKVNLSINDQLMARIDAYAAANYMTRSGLVTQATSNFLAAQEGLLAIKELAVLFRRISDAGEIDDETKARLADIEAWLKVAQR